MYLVEGTSHEFCAEPLRVTAAVRVAPADRRIGAVAKGLVGLHRHLGGNRRLHRLRRLLDHVLLLLFSGDPRSAEVGLEVKIVVVTTNGAIVLCRVGAVVRARADGDKATVGTDRAGGGRLVLRGFGGHTVALKLALRLKGSGNQILASVRGLLAGHGDLVTPAAGSGTREVLAGAVGRVHHLLVGGVLHGAARTSIDDLQVQAVRALAAGNYRKRAICEFIIRQGFSQF